MPRSPLPGGIKADAAADLLQRAAWDYRAVLAQTRQLAETVEEQARRIGDLEAQLAEEKTRAELLVGEAMLDAHKAGQALKAEAEADAEALRAEAEALLAPARQEAEQYKLLAADVQHRSVEFLRRALEALGADAAAPEASGEEVAPFRKPDQQAAGE